MSEQLGKIEGLSPTIPPNESKTHAALSGAHNKFKALVKAGSEIRESMPDYEMMGGKKVSELTSKAQIFTYKDNLEKMLKTDMGGKTNRKVYKADTPRLLDAKGNKKIHLTSAKGSSTGLVDQEVALSAVSIKKGKAVRTMKFSVAVLAQAKNVNVFDMPTPVTNYNLTNMNTVRIGEKSTYSITATPERLQAILDKKTPLPDFNDLNTLKRGDLVSINVGQLATGNSELRAMTGKKMFQAGVYSDAGINFETIKRISVLKEKSPSGANHVVVSIFDVDSAKSAFKLGGIVQTKKLPKSKLNPIVNSYAHLTLAKENTDVTREGVFVELNIDSKAGKEAYKKIMSEGDIPPEMLHANSNVVSSGIAKSEGEVEKNDVNFTSYTVAKVPLLKKNQQHTFGNQTGLTYEADQRSSYQYTKGSNDSVMSKQNAVYADVDGGAQGVNLTADTAQSFVRKQRSANNNQIDAVNTRSDGSVVNTYKSHSAARVNESNAIKALQRDVDLVANGKKPVFRSITLNVGKEELSGKEAVDYLKEHGPEKGWFDDNIVNITIGNSSDFIGAAKMIADDNRAYMESINPATNGQLYSFAHPSDLGAGFASYEGSEWNVGSEWSNNNEKITDELLLKRFSDGRLLSTGFSDMRRVARRAETYPLDIEITLPPEMKVLKK